MADHSILFNALMIQALLAGRKFQTRRILKLIPDEVETFHCVGTDAAGRKVYEMRNLFGDHVGIPIGNGLLEMQHKSKFAVGDRLIAREAFSGPYAYKPKANPPATWPADTPIWFWADGNPEQGDWGKPKPGMHLPQIFSRVTLHVTDVRVERLNDISDEDAIAEGIEPVYDDRSPGKTLWKDYETYTHKHVRVPHPYAVVPFEKPHRSYCSLWEEINGHGSWAVNPWVTATSFTVDHRNIEEIRNA